MTDDTSPLGISIQELKAYAEMKRSHAEALSDIARLQRKRMDELKTISEQRAMFLEVDLAETAADDAQALWLLADARLRQAREAKAMPDRTMLDQIIEDLQRQAAEKRARAGELEAIAESLDMIFRGIRRDGPALRQKYHELDIARSRARDANSDFKKTQRALNMTMARRRPDGRTEPQPPSVERK